METDFNPNVSSKTLAYYACFMLILTGVVVYTSWNSSVQKQSNEHVGDPLLTQNKIAYDLVYKVESYTDGWIQWCIAVLFRCHTVFV